MPFDDQRKRTGRGGPREGAGRPPFKGPKKAPHRPRTSLPKGSVVHVTMRVRHDVPRLRTTRMIRELRKTWAAGCERGSFRLVHFSLQQNHAHLIVEARDKTALASGMKSIGARFARAANRVFRRKGPVLSERFHHRVLTTPGEVRRALAYVLLNVRKHWLQRTGSRPPARLDLASSGRWFDGWKPKDWVAPEDRAGPREVAEPRSWLLTKGWRRRGLVHPAEVPGRVA